MLVTDHALAWGKRVVPYADLIGIAYWVMASLGRPAKVRFIGTGPVVHAHYEAAARALVAHAGREMINDAIDRIEAGQTVKFGGWTLERQSAGQRRTRVAWTNPIEFVPSRKFFGGWFVRAVADGRHKEIGMILREVANGPLLPELLDACVRRYGSGAVDCTR